MSRSSVEGTGLPPVVATPRTMALATAMFWVVGGVMSLVLTFGPHQPDARLVAIRSAAALGVVLGPLVLRLGEHLPPRVHEVLNLLGAALITGGVWLSAGGALGISLATMFVLNTVYAFAFFRPATAAVHVAFTTVLAMLLCRPLDLLRPQLVFAGVMVNLLTAGTVAWLVRVAERAERDSVTGLLNRRGFDRRLEAALAEAQHAGASFAVGYLDLDHFRRLNETDGRATGDRVLRETARIWQEMLPEEACLAHGGSGEFVVLLPGSTAEASSRLVERMRGTLPHLGTASAGLAEWAPDDTKSVLLSRADASLYRAKRAGRNRIDPRVGMDVSAREMREALVDGCFRVVDQPIVDLTTEALMGAEALVRWQHPTRGLLSPADFIPLAEESGAIVELGRFVLRTACEAVAVAARQGRSLDKLTVNVSGLQLRQPGYAAEVLDVLEQNGWDPARLVLEVTESSLAAEDGVSVTALEELRSAGIRIAIDDFGTGYSSLSRLAHLPVDILKIDRSFVSSIVPGKAAPIIASITALAEALGLATVAEGVEHHAQAAVLAMHGCDRGQGWLYGRPVPLDTLAFPPPPLTSPSPTGTPAAAPTSADPAPTGPAPAGFTPAGFTPAGPAPAGPASAGPVSAGPVPAQGSPRTSTTNHP